MAGGWGEAGAGPARLPVLDHAQAVEEGPVDAGLRFGAEAAAGGGVGGGPVETAKQHVGAGVRDAHFEEEGAAGGDGIRCVGWDSSSW